MIYHITHPRFQGGAVRIQCTPEGEAVKVYLAEPAYIRIGMDIIMPPAREAGTNLFRFSPADIQRLRSEGYVITQEEEDIPTNKKIALWCRIWAEFKPVKYTMVGADAGRIKGIRLSEELLRWYLNDKDMPQTPATWHWRGKQSVSNLVRYYNEVRAAMVAPPESKHPDHWSREHMMKLDGPSIAEYHKHLKSLGLVPKKHADGSILDYVKP